MFCGGYSAVNPAFKEGWAEQAYGPMVVFDNENIDFSDKIFNVFKSEKVLWQIINKSFTGNRIDYYFENVGINCMNILCPILSMGAPVELISTMDIYLTELAIKSLMTKL